MYVVLALFWFLITSLGKLSKTPSDGTLLERTSRRFLWCWLLLLLFFLTEAFYVFGLLFFATGTPTRLLTPWKPPQALNSTLATFGCLTFCQAFSVTVLPRALRFWVGIFYPQPFFTLLSFTKIFGTVCDSDTGRSTPSRILLCACPHRVVPFGWRMDLTYSHCSYKTIDLSIEPVSHEV